VPQEDIVLETLTVRENIAYSAMLRLPRSTEAAVRDDIVDEVIHVLQLDLVQHEQVGGGSVRGLSGGQRKRVNIGLEMASDCGLLFLDEPTSGLDASSSLDILTALKTLTALGVTIIAVIHQPRYQIFNMFDHLLVLAAGKLAFCGPPRATIPYFEMLGYPSPSEINPADFLLDLVSKMQHGQPLWKTWIAFAADPESFLRGDHMSKASGKVANTLMDSFDGFRTRFSKFQEHSTPSLADDEVAKVLQILSDMTLEEQRLHETVKLSEYDEMRFPQFLALCLRLLGDYSMPEAEIIEIFNELDRGDDKVFDHEDMMVFVAKHSPNTLLDEAGDAGAGIELLLPSETPSVLVKTKRPLSPRNVSPRNGSPRNGSPRNVSPRKQRRGAFIESEGFELTPNVPEKMSPRRRSRSAFISKSFALDGDTSGELDTGDSQARKVAPSYIKQFVIFVRRCLLLRLKPGAYGADALEILLLCAVSATLAFAFGGRKTELVDVPTLAFLRSLALALLASLSSLKVLGTSQLFLRREEQSGLSGALFCWAAMTAGLINVILRPCLFTLVFQIFTQSEILVYQDALASLSIWWCFSGITHLIVALVPYSVALPIAALLPLFTCFFSGVSPSLSTLVSLLILLYLSLYFCFDLIDVSTIHI
jgi:ABC-type multidrug transport system ATPase subunit